MTESMKQLGGRILIGFARASSDYRFTLKKYIENDQATYPIRIRNVSDTARAQNVDSSTF